MDYYFISGSVIDIKILANRVLAVSGYNQLGTLEFSGVSSYSNLIYYIRPFTN